MNERMHELARQAKIEFTLDPTERPIRAFVECWEDELAKFAELIVRECADVGNDSNQSKNRAVGVSVGDVIRKHFGVES